jgi:hypothetical protein
MEKTPLKMHGMPRDRYDWRLNAILIATAVLVELVLLTLLPLLGFLGQWLLRGLLIYLMVKFVQITLLRVDVSDEGIHAVGLLGRGRLIPWDQIESVEEIDRETYFRDALRCLWTSNLSPLSGTFSGVFKVRLKNGQYWLFPPADRALFERKVLWKRQTNQPLPRYYAQTEKEPDVQVSRRWWQ